MNIGDKVIVQLWNTAWSRRRRVGKEFEAKVLSINNSIGVSDRVLTEYIRKYLKTKNPKMYFVEALDKTRSPLWVWGYEVKKCSK